MNKKILVLLSVIIFFFNSIFIAFAQEIKDTRASQGKMVQDFLLVMLYPYMAQAIEQYYGKPKQFELHTAKIIDIKRFTEKGQFYFEIKVQVRTFEGPHNPPYGFETITMVNDLSGITITNFEHSNKKLD